MQFTCQRTGTCCTHPNIVITLTHEDLWTLYQESQDLEELLQIIQFLIPDTEANAQKLVLKTLETTSGKGLFVLRKNTRHQCIFYNVQERACQIHSLRPQACRNFPFAFNKEKDILKISLVKDAPSFCLGIGKGKEYTREELEKTGSYTLNRLDEYNKIVDEINKEAKNKKSLTPQEALTALIMVAEKNKEKISKEHQIL